MQLLEGEGLLTPRTRAWLLRHQEPSRRQGIGSAHVRRNRLGAILARAAVLAEHDHVYHRHQPVRAYLAGSSDLSISGLATCVTGCLRTPAVAGSSRRWLACHQTSARQLLLRSVDARHRRPGPESRVASSCIACPCDPTSSYSLPHRNCCSRGSAEYDRGSPFRISGQALDLTCGYSRSSTVEKRIATAGKVAP